MLTAERTRTGRTEVDLLHAQVAAIEAWNREARAVAVRDADVLGREGRLDRDRRSQVQERVRQAVVEQAARQLRGTGAPLAATRARRAVVAHRQGWMRDAVAAQLGSLGVTVVSLLDDGADALGTALVEQPDLVLLEARLPSLCGADAVARVRRLCPRTVVGCQLHDGGEAEPLLQAGAHAVFSRRVPPADVAEQLAQCLDDDDPQVVVL